MSETLFTAKSSDIRDVFPSKNEISVNPRLKNCALRILLFRISSIVSIKTANCEIVAVSISRNLMYSIVSENIDRWRIKVSIKHEEDIFRHDDVIHSVVLSKNLFYDFFRRGGEEWFVFGSDSESGFKLYNLTRQLEALIPYRSIINAYVWRDVKVNPTGEFLLCVSTNDELEFAYLKNVINFECYLFNIKDETNRWYNGEGDYYALRKEEFDNAEWVSNYCMVIPYAMYKLVFTVSKKNVKIEWRDGTLFELLYKNYTK